MSHFPGRRLSLFALTILGAHAGSAPNLLFGARVTDAPPLLQQVPDTLSAVPLPGPVIEVFVAEGCPHCADAERFLSELQEERPGLQIDLRDVTRDRGAIADLEALAESAGIRGLSVPTFRIRESIVVGFDSPETTGAIIVELLDAPTAASIGGSPDSLSQVEPEVGFRVPILGWVRADDLGLPALTAVIGLLDGFNPCAMWILLFLLSFLVNVGGRWRMFLIGGTFVLVSGIAYFAFMAAWLNIFLLIGVSRLIQLALAAVAGGMGVLNVKDFFALGTGPSLGIPERAKPGLYGRIRRILNAEDLSGALAGAVALAVLVNTVELICTAGLPALYTHILAQRSLSTAGYYGYLALYNVFYMLDDALMLTVAVVTLSSERLAKGKARWLKLVSGTIMLILAAILAFRPTWLAI